MIVKHHPHNNLEPYWHALHVRQKYERTISARLDELGIENLLPLTKVLRAYKSQKRRVIVPMFPGYIFLNIQPIKRHQIIHLKGVYGYVKIGREYQRVHDQEIANIRLLVENMDIYRDMRPEAYIRRGSLIDVTEGPLCGMRGLVTGNTGNRILVSLDSIQTAISISLPQHQVELMST